MNLPADVWVPVPMRWRNVRSGDIVLSAKAGGLWTVIDDFHPLWKIQGIKVQCGSKVFKGHVDPDDTVQVLVPVTERDAMRVARDELAAQVVERRAAAG